MPSKETLDQLRALGYVDFGAEKADPAVAGVVVYDPERSYPGYNLYTVRPFYRADLVDADGNLVHSWEGVGDPALVAQRAASRRRPAGCRPAEVCGAAELGW